MWPPSGEDLAVELLGEIAGGAAQRRGRRRQRQRREGERDAGAQPVLAVRHFARHRAEIADLDGQRLQEGAIEGKLGALQHDRGMLQPGNDALCGRAGLPGDAGNVAAMRWRSSRTPGRGRWRRQVRCRRRAYGAASESHAASFASRDWARRSGTATCRRFRPDVPTADSGHSRSRARSAGRRGAGPAARSGRVPACGRNSASDRPARRAGAGASCARTPSRQASTDASCCRQRVPKPLLIVLCPGTEFT